MGVRDESGGEAGGEASETLLEKNGSATQRVNTDSTLREQVVERQNSRRWNCSIILAFALFNTAALVVMYLALTGRRILTPSDRLFPQREYETVVLHHKRLRPGPETDAEWEAEGPKANGYFIIDDPDSLGLPPGLEGGGANKRYGLSWAHQYHCLWKLRDEFWLFVANNSSLIGKSLEDDDPESVHLWHLAHCFDYIKQAVTCSMDMTVEYPTVGGHNVINGYEIEHRCTKRSIYDQYMEDHAASL